MEDLILKQLKNLRLIEPTPAFAKKGRMLFAKPAKKTGLGVIWPALYFTGIFAVIAFFAIIKFGGENQTVSAALNSDTLNKEFNNLSINIELQEISYRQDVDQAIASALSEIGNTKTSHLNSNLLESENNFDLPPATNPDIDDLLDRVIF